MSVLSYLTNNDIISSRAGLETGVENDMFWSETGSGFQDLGGTPPTRIPRFTLLPHPTPPPPQHTHTHTHTHTRCTLTVKASRTVFTLTLQ